LKNTTQNQPDLNPQIIPLHWPGEKGRSSVRAPEDLKERLDDVIRTLRIDFEMEISRNEFILNAVHHYLACLEEVESVEDLTKYLQQYSS